MPAIFIYLYHVYLFVAFFIYIFIYVLLCETSRSCYSLSTANKLLFDNDYTSSSYQRCIATAVRTDNNISLMGTLLMAA